MKRDLYRELDSILDTRLSTLLNFDFDLGKEWIEKGDYSKRSTDSFKYLSSGVFNILYRERNKATLLNPLPTPMLGMITEYCEKARVEDVSMGGDGLITIHLNTYPYNLSTEELEFILSGIMTKLNNSIDIKLLHSDNISPLWIRDNVSMMIKYDGIEWLDRNIANGKLRKHSIPEVILVTPTIIQNNMSITIEEMDNIYENMARSSAPFIEIGWIDIGMFSTHT